MRFPSFAQPLSCAYGEPSSPGGGRWRRRSAHAGDWTNRLRHYAAASGPYRPMGDLEGSAGGPISDAGYTCGGVRHSNPPMVNNSNTLRTWAAETTRCSVCLRKADRRWKPYRVHRRAGCGSFRQAGSRRVHARLVLKIVTSRGTLGRNVQRSWCRMRAGRWSAVSRAASAESRREARAARSIIAATTLAGEELSKARLPASTW